MVNGYLETVGCQVHSVWCEYEIVISSEGARLPAPIRFGLRPTPRTSAGQSAMSFIAAGIYLTLAHPPVARSTSSLPGRCSVLSRS